MKLFYKCLFAIGTVIQIAADYITKNAHYRAGIRVLAALLMIVAIIKSDIKKLYKQIFVGILTLTIVLILFVG